MAKGDRVASVEAEVRQMRTTLDSLLAGLRDVVLHHHHPDPAGGAVLAPTAPAGGAVLAPTAPPPAATPGETPDEVAGPTLDDVLNPKES